jgi:beta-N-acetylhexosaminidase
MNDTLLRDAYAVLLPGHPVLEFDDGTRRFFESGGVTVLIATDRREYLNRRVSPHRIATETAETFRSFLSKAHTIAGPMLVAADQELGGTQRLHRRLDERVASLPGAAEAFKMSDAEIEERSAQVGQAAKRLGVNMFISPIVDVVTGVQPWLMGRALGSDAGEVGRIASSYIRGVQSQGVVATAKHFPGYRELWNDPAVEDARQLGTREELNQGLETFRKVLEAGPHAVMVGPAPVDALDPSESASTSRIVIDLLRSEFRYEGIIVSDDLDSTSVLRGGRVEEAAIKSLVAGVDLLLLASGPQVDSVAAALVSAVKTGRVPPGMLEKAAKKIRSAAQRFGTN